MSYTFEMLFCVYLLSNMHGEIKWLAPKIVEHFIAIEYNSVSFEMKAHSVRFYRAVKFNAKSVNVAWLNVL